MTRSSRKKRSKGGQPYQTPSSDKTDQSEDESEVYEKELQQAISNTSFKRQQTRVNAYQRICEGLVQRYCPDALTHHKEVLIESLKRSLRKGSEEEQIWATNVLPLLAFQSETFEAVMKLLETLKPTMIDLMKDASPECSNVRVKCCTVLATLCFLGDNNTNEIVSIMKILQEVLQHKTIQYLGELQAAVLGSWSLLLTLLPPRKTLQHVQSDDLLSPRKLIAMLDSAHLEVRTASVETLALMYELCHQYDANFLQDDLPVLLTTVHKLSTDAYRFQAKRGRKLQRITFRDVLLYLKQGIVPAMRIKLGDEWFYLNSWTLHHKYNCLKDVLGMAMNVHLKGNPLVRDILDLGPKAEPIAKRPAGRMSKIVAQQCSNNTATAKQRTITRGRERQKRLFNLE